MEEEEGLFTKQSDDLRHTLGATAQRRRRLDIDDEPLAPIAPGC